MSTGELPAAMRKVPRDMHVAQIVLSRLHVKRGYRRDAGHRELYLFQAGRTEASSWPPLGAGADDGAA